MTADAAFQNTMDKKAFLEQEGFEIVEMWECTLRAELRRNPEMQGFFNSLEIPEPLDPRNTFFGGRTNATCLYYKAAPGERISYVDICSLYPWVCKYGKFLIGHPKIITENFAKISADSKPYTGVISCKILPPHGLLHPVLPYRANKKLMFPLCRSCVTEQNQDQCDHSNAERSLSGTWVLDEVYKALELNYELLDTSEVWHYEKVNFKIIFNLCKKITIYILQEYVVCYLCEIFF